MTEIETFVKQAREKGLDDDAIRKGLEAKGWDKAAIDIALIGLDIPSPPTVASQVTASPVVQHQSLSPLMAAIHHVILWFFSGSSAVAIGGTVASLYGFQVSSTALASMIAVTLITFIPYALLFGILLAKNFKVVTAPNKTWSIITICLHSIGAMIAAIIAVINIITGGEHVYLVSAALIFVLDVLIITTYANAAFVRPGTVRKSFMLLHLPLLIAMFGTLFVLASLGLGPVQHDDALRKDLAATVKAIAAETKKNDKLPDSIDSLTSNRTITYQKTSTTNYKICAEFQTSRVNDSYYYSNESNERTDAYTSESSFFANKPGKQCFDFSSSYLTEEKNTTFLKPSIN